jgi:hypothetical protein
VRPDADTSGDGLFAAAAHDAGVAGVEAAGDVRAGHDVEERLVVAHAVCAVTLTEVAVEVDGASRRR